MVTVMESERDVAFTSFMLKIRDSLSHSDLEPVSLTREPSPVVKIAVAVDEWYSLRSYAEHVLSEANGMLAADQERILLEDEYGTDELAFSISWRGETMRFLLYRDTTHTGQVRLSTDGPALPEKPADVTFINDLLVDMVRKGVSGRAS